VTISRVAALVGSAVAVVIVAGLPGCTSPAEPPAGGTEGASPNRAQPTEAEPTEATEAEPTEEPRPRRDRTVRLAFAGDVLAHDALWKVARADARRAGEGGAFEFAPLFEPVRPLIESADLAVCHLETPVAPAEGPFSGYPTFSVPPQILGGITAAGFDACTTASNHSVDQGFDGLSRTLSALDQREIPHTGTARSPREQRHLLRVEVGGLEIVLLSYTYGTNGIPLEADKPWSVNLIDPASIRADARRAKATGADAVVVGLHWGDEYTHSPSDYQRTIAEQVTRSAAVDLVYGHHAHVVQPVRKVNGTWVAYGLGNFVAAHSTEVVGVYEGMVVEFDLTRLRGGEVKVRWTGYRPTYISPSNGVGMRVYDIRSALGRASVTQPLPNDLPSDLRSDLRAAGARVRAVVGRAPR